MNANVETLNEAIPAKRDGPAWIALVVTTIVVLVAGSWFVFDINESQQEQAAEIKRAQARMDVPPALP